MTDSHTDFIANSHVEDAYLGKHALQLTTVTSEQMQKVYEARGIGFPIEVSSVLHFLLRHDGAALADIAKALRVPHQLCAQRVKKLVALALVTKRSDPKDARRTHLILTDKGREQAQLLVDCMEDTAIIYRELFEEIGCDLTGAIAQALAAIQLTPLPERFARKFAEQELTR